MSFQKTPVDIGGCEVDQGERAQEDQRWDWSELISSHQGEEVGEMPAEFQGYLLIRRGGTDPFLAPTKQSLELVIMWTESPPRAQMAMREGMIGASIPNMRSANVTAIASLASMAEGLRTAR